MEYNKTETENYTLETYGSFDQAENHDSFIIKTKRKDEEEEEEEVNGIQEVSDKFVQLLQNKGGFLYSEIHHKQTLLVRITHK
jgi:hypothetical protein